MAHADLIHSAAFRLYLQAFEHLDMVFLFVLLPDFSTTFHSDRRDFVVEYLNTAEASFLLERKEALTASESS